MFDINTLTTAAVIALGLAIWAVLLRVSGRAEPADLAAMFGTRWELDWPRGVQEEEPSHWRLDRLDAVPAAGVRLRALAPLDDCAECAEEAAA